MMNKTKLLKIKILFVIFIIIISTIIPNQVMAQNEDVANGNNGATTTTPSITLDDIINNGNSFLNIGDSSNITTETEVKDISDWVSGILLTIAIGVTLISAIIMGINFLTQTVEDKAKIKESMTPWVIGIFISFGAYTIWKITMNIFMNL